MVLPLLGPLVAPLALHRAYLLTVTSSLLLNACLPVLSVLVRFLAPVRHLCPCPSHRWPDWGGSGWGGGGGPVGHCGGPGGGLAWEREQVSSWARTPPRGALPTGRSAPLSPFAVGKRVHAATSGGGRLGHPQPLKMHNPIGPRMVRCSGGSSLPPTPPPPPAPPLYAGDGLVFVCQGLVAPQQALRPAGGSIAATLSSCEDPCVHFCSVYPPMPAARPGCPVHPGGGYLWGLFPLPSRT